MVQAAWRERAGDARPRAVETGHHGRAGDPQHERGVGVAHAGHVDERHGVAEVGGQVGDDGVDLPGPADRRVDVLAATFVVEDVEERAREHRELDRGAEPLRVASTRAYASCVSSSAAPVSRRAPAPGGTAASGGRRLRELIGGPQTSAATVSEGAASRIGSRRPSWAADCLDGRFHEIRVRGGGHDRAGRDRRAKLVRTYSRAPAGRDPATRQGRHPRARGRGIDHLAYGGVSTSTEPRERIEELAARLTELRDAYYRGEPLVADADYDALEDELRALLAEHPDLTPDPNPLEQRRRARRPARAGAPQPADALAREGDEARAGRRVLRPLPGPAGGRDAEARRAVAGARLRARPARPRGHARRRDDRRRRHAARPRAERRRAGRDRRRAAASRCAASW